jgi:hypothetical protein
MASSALSGIRSPASPRSGATSPRPNKFDSDQLKTYIKKLLASTLQNVTWLEFKERERGRALMKEIGDRVKERMLGTPVRLSEDPETTEPFIEIEPRGLWVSVLTYLIQGSHSDDYTRSKYIVLTQVNENVGQGGR